MAGEEDERARAERSWRAGIELEGSVAEASAAIRERSKAAYGDRLLAGRMTLMGLAAELVGLRAGQPGKTEEAISQRLALIVAAVQGAGVTETLISEGQYIKAAGALRQDLEILARLREIDEGLAVIGKQSNIKNAPMGSGPVYGYLSGITHVAKPDVIDRLLGQQQVGPEAFGIAVVPVFDEDAAVGLYELHVWMLIELIREMIRTHIDLYGEDDDLTLIITRWARIGDVLVEAGHLKTPDPPADS